MKSRSSVPPLVPVPAMFPSLSFGTLFAQQFFVKQLPRGCANRAESRECMMDA